MSRRCRFEEGAWIPECWGGVIYGKNGCYCNRADPLKALERRVARLEKLLANKSTVVSDYGASSE